MPSPPDLALRSTHTVAHSAARTATVPVTGLLDRVARLTASVERLASLGRVVSPSATGPSPSLGPSPASAPSFLAPLAATFTRLESIAQVLATRIQGRTEQLTEQVRVRVERVQAIAHQVTGAAETVKARTERVIAPVEQLGSLAQAIGARAERVRVAAEAVGLGTVAAAAERVTALSSLGQQLQGLAQATREHVGEVVA
jgi:uncharacterized protein YoxC